MFRPVLSIIIPIKANNFDVLHGFSECYNQLAMACNSIQIVVVDDSKEDVFDRLDRKLDNNPNILHFKPASPCQQGDNCKLNSIQAALEKTYGNCVALFDDDVRPTAQNVSAILNAFQDADIIRCMVRYEKPSFFDSIELAGIYIINMVSPLKQFWGNVCFQKTMLKISFFDRKDVLFDELAIESHCRKSSQRFRYVSFPPLQMISVERTWRQFWEQRIRFAYENIIFRFRFALFLSTLPILMMVSYFTSLIYGVILFFVINNIVALIAFLGQLQYGGHHKKTIWLYGVLWFWFYPLTSWIALILWFSGGKKFRDHKIRNVI